MSGLKASAIEVLRQALQERHGRLRDEIREVLTRTGEHPYGELADVPDIGDESTADLLIDLDQAMVHRDVEEVRDIEAALARIGKGDYGICIACGLDIAYARLQAFPTAKRCLACQAQRERTYVHAATPNL